MLSKPTVIETKDFEKITALQNKSFPATVSRPWTIGNLEILKNRLLGLFCSTKCPGNIILRTYDLIRMLRDAEIPIIGGFHSPMEKECLELLLRGKQPIVISPARSIENMRIPKIWRAPISEGRLLILSPFAFHHRRPIVEIAAIRNQLVAAIADEIFVAYASEGSKTEVFCSEIIASGKSVFTLDLEENVRLLQLGAIAKNISALEQSFKASIRC
jgi:predicted Rossmann fold nucleotide-binding protein DprA/Smf involved in DNA uptake